MGYSSITTWDVADWNDEMEGLARDTFVPLIMSAGATRVQMVRTGELTFSVVTEYTDAKAAEAAQTKITDIRAKATQDLPMTLSGSSSGGVFAHS